jgi:hypothetical protein
MVYAGGFGAISAMIKFKPATIELLQQRKKTALSVMEMRSWCFSEGSMLFL